MKEGGRGRGKVEERGTRRAETSFEVSTVYTRPSRPLRVIYFLLPALPFVYVSSFSRMSIFLASFPTLFHFPRLRQRSSSRRMFVPTVLYHSAIISHTCHSPSVSPLPPSVIPPILTHARTHTHTCCPSPLAALSRGLL